MKESGAFEYTGSWELGSSCVEAGAGLGLAGDVVVFVVRYCGVRKSFGVVGGERSCVGVACWLGASGCDCFGACVKRVCVKGFCVCTWVCGF